MKKTLLVAVQSEESHLYDLTHQSLKNRGDDCHILDNLWLVSTDDSPEELYDYLSPYLLDNRTGITLFVNEVKGKWFCNSKNEGECFEGLTHLLDITQQI